MKLYVYDGPVLVFGEPVCDKLYISTWAVSEKQAMSNMKYRFRQSHGYSPTVPVSMPGSIHIIKAKEKPYEQLQF